MNALALLDRPFTEQDVCAVEEAFLSVPNVECPVSHHFGPGVYIREVVMPAGAYVIGHSHRDCHLNVMLEGRLTLIREDGTNEVIEAPKTFVGYPGRKIAYIHETVRWQNIYAATETDVGKLEERLFDKSDVFVSAQTAALENHSFTAAIEAYGFTPEEVTRISEDESDMVELPYGEYKFTTGVSPIHGRGIFATGDYEPGEFIAAGRIDGKRTVVGRYTNHSHAPNAGMIEADGDIYMVAKSKIFGCKGGMNGDEITIDYRHTLSLSLGVR